MKTHDELFDEYVEAMKTARARSEEWWSALLATEQAKGVDEAAAIRAIRSRWPYGPASHPYVLAAFRAYFLACQDLNDQIKEQRAGAPPAGREPDESAWGVETIPEGPEATPVPPNVFVFDLLRGREDELSAFLDGLVLSPIGLDDKGHFA